MTHHDIPGWITWELPERWTSEMRNGILCLTAPDGYGAVHMGFVCFGGEVDPEKRAQQTLRRMAARHGVTVQQEKLEWKNHAAVASGRLILPDEGGHTLSMAWAFVQKTRAIMVTYTANLEDGLTELPTVLEIVNSIQVMDELVAK